MEVRAGWGGCEGCLRGDGGGDGGANWRACVSLVGGWRGSGRGVEKGTDKGLVSRWVGGGNRWVGGGRLNWRVCLLRSGGLEAGCSYGYGGDEKRSC